MRESGAIPSDGRLYFDKSSANEAARESGSARPSEARIPIFVIAALRGTAADRAALCTASMGLKLRSVTADPRQVAEPVHRAGRHLIGCRLADVAGSRWQRAQREAWRAPILTATCQRLNRLRPII